MLWLVLLAITLVGGSFERDVDKFNRQRRAASECSSVWCTNRSLRRAARYLRQMKSSGDRVVKRNRRAVLACKHGDCQKLAVATSKSFCAGYVKALSDGSKWLKSKCKSGSCKKDIGAIPSVEGCVGSVPKLVASTTTKKTDEAPKPTAASTEEPLSSCEQSIRRKWAEEFKRRAREHKEISHLHREAARCITHSCTVLLERKRHVLDNRFARARLNREIRLKSKMDKCPSMSVAKKEEIKKALKAIAEKAKKNLEKERRKEAAEMAKKAKDAKKTKKPSPRVTKATKMDKSTKQRAPKTSVETLPPIDTSTCTGRSAELNIELNELLSKMDACEGAACRASLHDQIDQIRGQLDQLGDCDSPTSTGLSVDVSSAATDSTDDKANSVPILATDGMKKGKKESSAEKEEKERVRKLSDSQLKVELEEGYGDVILCSDEPCKKRVVSRINVLSKEMAARGEAQKKKGKGYKHDKQFASAARIASRKRIEKHLRYLRITLSRCRSRKCRHVILKRFRNDVESRQLALFRQLKEMAAAKSQDDQDACKGRWSKDAKKLQACIDAVKDWEKKRVANLEARQLKLTKRREQRLCDLTMDPKSCRAAVEQEYKREVKNAAPAKRSASASSLALGVSFLLFVLAFAATF